MRSCHRLFASYPEYWQTPVWWPSRSSDLKDEGEHETKSKHTTLGRRYSTARVSKRPSHRSAACLRARYCTNLACSDLAKITKTRNHGILPGVSLFSSVSYSLFTFLFCDL